ncbi:hypothetical protein E3N88_24831 [Mikania micrantha]|uniref:Uncharacterized protein n=1 Tax=Mikania micrantha TaxID=192012 RepID=A0A5N6N4A5_9ASTR|nr:hypothetical protein E3N88_24831 [Mikania micrantha]
MKEERAAKEHEERVAKAAPTNQEKNSEGFVIVKNRKNGNTGKTVSFQPKNTTFKQAGDTEIRGAVNYERADKQGTSSNPRIQRKMGEMFQNGKNKQVGKTGSKLNHQENSARKGNQPINPSKVNGKTANKSIRQPKVSLKNQFEIFEKT